MGVPDSNPPLDTTELMPEVQQLTTPELVTLDAMTLLAMVNMSFPRFWPLFVALLMSQACV
jgi:hypothetical protein